MERHFSIIFIPAFVGMLLLISVFCRTADNAPSMLGIEIGLFAVGMLSAVVLLVSSIIQLFQRQWRSVLYSLVSLLFFGICILISAKVGFLFLYAT